MKNNKDIDLEFLKLQYQVLANRQLSDNELIWNTPTLLFVAETFLWNLAFNERINPILSLLISLFSVVVAWASRQQFIRGRIMEIADSEQLLAIEKLIKEDIRQEKKPIAMIVYHTLYKRTVLIKGKERSLELRLKDCNEMYRNSSLAQKRTFVVWDKMFLLMQLLSIVLSLYNVFIIVQVYLQIPN